MKSSVGQAVALATHANAALAGFDVHLDIASHPWFNFWSDYRFGIGADRSRQLADTADGWFATLRDMDFKRAYFWFEPYDGDWSTIARIGFVGQDRWAPVTVAHGQEIIWHEELQHDPANERRPWRTWRGGYEVQAGQASVKATPEAAARDLDAALVRMIGFEQTYRRGEAFRDSFERARRWLASSGLVPSSERSGPADEDPAEIGSLFPADLYPTSSIALVSAVARGWVLGAMGSWNDWSSEDPTVSAEFRSITETYYQALGSCLVAACDVRLEEPKRRGFHLPFFS
jgi:hypothetical protein